jgi:hypothetical protein
LQFRIGANVPTGVTDASILKKEIGYIVDFPVCAAGFCLQRRTAYLSRNTAPA